MPQSVAAIADSVSWSTRQQKTTNCYKYLPCSALWISSRSGNTSSRAPVWRSKLWPHSISSSATSCVSGPASQCKGVVDESCECPLRGLARVSGVKRTLNSPKLTKIEVRFLDCPRSGRHFLHRNCKSMFPKTTGHLARLASRVAW